MVQPAHQAAIPEIADADIPLLMRALAVGRARIERVALSSGTVWIKRYHQKKMPIGLYLHRFLPKLIPVPFLKPSPVLSGAALVAREVRRIGAYRERGIAVPDIVYASASALVLRDAGETIDQKLNALKAADADAHDALLVRIAAALGTVHAAGLCHGRPHPRDMFERDGVIGFFDFEEEPESVMPLAAAQARDIWLLFLQVATRACDGAARDRARLAWEERAPAEAKTELTRMMAVLGRALPLARLIGRVRMGSDLRRFIMATEYLKHHPPGQTGGIANAQGRTG